MWFQYPFVIIIYRTWSGLWSLVFLFSNLSLFVFLPFAFLFNESEGFPGHRKVTIQEQFYCSRFITTNNIAILMTLGGFFFFFLQGLKARVYETCTVLMLLSIFVLVLTYLLYTFFYAEQSLFYMLFSKYNINSCLFRVYHVLRRLR